MEEENNKKKLGRPKGDDRQGLVTKTMLGRLSPEVNEHFKQFRLRPQGRRPNKNKKYMKPEVQINVDLGHDLLEHYGMVRKYMTKKHKISNAFLEFLFYLYPKQYFTPGNFKEYPKPQTIPTWPQMLEQGWIRLASKGKTQGKSLYTLTRKSAAIVTYFYAYLLGEKPMPARGNPLGREDATPVEKMSFKLIQKLNGIPPSENKKRFFE